MKEVIELEHKFNLLPDKPDIRDFLYKATASILSIPERVDLRKYFLKAVDQGYLGSCTANAIGGFRESLEIKGSILVVPLARLFMYYYERALIGRESTDSGAYLRDGMKLLYNIGMPPESLWPYDQSKFTIKPPTSCDEPALQYRIAEYHRVETIDDMFIALANEQPVVIGVLLWESFYKTGSDGIVPVYTPASGDMPLGGHAMVACGYKTIDGRRYVLCRNSWGEGWGEGGYCWMPPEYLYLFSDMWTGVVKVTPDNFTFKSAVDTLVGAGIFDTPEFWYNYEQKFLSGTLTNADAQFVFLAFRKFAADKVNNR